MQSKIHVSLFVCILITHSVFSQDNGEIESISGVYSKRFANIFSTIIDPASLVDLKVISFGLFAERKFALRELESFSSAINYPLPRGGIGLSIRHEGDKNYGTSTFGIAYAKNLSSMNGGISLLYKSLHSAGINKGELSVRVSITIQLTQAVRAGISFSDPQSLFEKNPTQSSLPAYCFGLGYESSGSVLAYFSLSRQVAAPVAIHAGIRYLFSKQFVVALGVAGPAYSPFFSCSTGTKGIQIYLRFGYHSQLGISPALAICFESKKNIKD